MSRRTYRPFRFKRFEVSHSLSAHKVGVDGVLLGLLCPLPQGGGHILDVGCGSGVISLVLAQKTEKSGAYIHAIDIDQPSVEECGLNFEKSPWKERLNVRNGSYDEILKQSILSWESETHRYDLIVSNPPYFDSGIDSPETRREVARHGASLSPEVLVKTAGALLKQGGYLTLIVPSDRIEILKDLATEAGLELIEIIMVRGHENAPVKRAVLTFTNDAHEAEVSEHTLTLEIQPGIPTEEYRRLGKDFYLYF